MSEESARIDASGSRLLLWRGLSQAVIEEPFLASRGQVVDGLFSVTIKSRFFSGEVMLSPADSALVISRAAGPIPAPPPPKPPPEPTPRPMPVKVDPPRRPLDYWG